MACRACLQSFLNALIQSQQAHDFGEPTPCSGFPNPYGSPSENQSNFLDEKAILLLQRQDLNMAIYIICAPHLSHFSSSLQKELRSQARVKVVKDGFQPVANNLSCKTILPPTLPFRLIQDSLRL